MRFFLLSTSVCLLTLLAGCSTAPKTEEAKVETKSEPTPAPASPEPAAPAATETTPAAATPAAPAAPVALTTDEQKTIYAVGLALSRNLTPLALNEAELEIVKRGISDAVLGKPAVELEVWGPKIDGMIQNRQAGMATREKAAGKAYAEKAATQPGAVKTASGLVYRELKAGSGASPKASDTVKVHYRGTLINGKEFDSSYKRNSPIEFPLTGVIACWTEGVQKMKIGGKSQLVCPADIAYGDGGKNDIPGGATLVFEVELLGIR